MLSEALASLTCDVQALSSPGMHIALPAGPWAFRNWLGLQVDLNPGLLVATWTDLALHHGSEHGRRCWSGHSCVGLGICGTLSRMLAWRKTWFLLAKGSKMCSGEQAFCSVSLRNFCWLCTSLLKEKPGWEGLSTHPCFHRFAATLLSGQHSLQPGLNQNSVAFAWLFCYVLFCF